MEERESGGSPLRSVRLLEVRGPTSRFVDAEVREDGSLVVCGQDVGDLPRRMFDDGDYEFWVTVPARAKDDLLLALIESRWAGRDRAVDEFRDFCRERGVESEFGTWS